MSSKRYQEKLYSFYGQQFSVEEWLYEDISAHQELVLFRNKKFGRVLALDGIIQTTEADEACYHEMMVHVPMLSFGHAKNILVIGGGDGGIIREVLKHDIHEVTMVEIDKDVIEFSKRYLPKHSAGSFDHPKLKLVIDDGARFVKKSHKKYDVIIVDSTDPIGPGAVLFTQEFYDHCYQILSEGGILVTQNGVPFFQEDELVNTWQRQSSIFKHPGFYTVAVPTYIGGLMTLSFASDMDYKNLSIDEISKRYRKSKLGSLYYYTPAIHQASFALPAFMQKKLK